MAKKEEKELAVKENNAVSALTQVTDIFSKFRKTAVFKELADQVSNDTQVYGLAPRIVMDKGDAKKFIIDNGALDEAEVLVCTLVTYTKQNEYRQNPNEKAPTCSSVGGENGTLFGKCSTCKYAIFDQAANKKDCVSSYRLLVSILGTAELDKRGNIDILERVKDFKENPFELKVPSKSIAPFKEYLRSVAKTKPEHYEIEGKITPVEVLTVLTVGKEKAATGNVSVLQFDILGTLQDIMIDLTKGNETYIDPEAFAEFVARTFKYIEDPDLKFQPTEYREPVNFIPAKETTAAPKPAKEEKVEEAVIVDKGEVVENTTGEALPF